MSMVQLYANPALVDAPAPRTEGGRDQRRAHINIYGPQMHMVIYEGEPGYDEFHSLALLAGQPCPYNATTCIDVSISKEEFMAMLACVANGSAV